jgi:hypothetical protein
VSEGDASSVTRRSKARRQRETAGTARGGLADS